MRRQRLRLKVYCWGSAVQQVSSASLSTNRTAAPEQKQSSHKAQAKLAPAKILYDDGMKRGLGTYTLDARACLLEL